uniref:Uncharacterized protein n=1 Tax=Picea glauca TaxID=3330 RepID=A0A101M1W1_PICGL|nr:hypothetical protein ABT39_MTgene3988 [Picea glauca]QHR86968.1 hypothetical protein Q903MT_gene977 [Picea sitchensis]
MEALIYRFTLDKEWREMELGVKYKPMRWHLHQEWPCNPSLSEVVRMVWVLLYQETSRSDLAI